MGSKYASGKSVLWLRIIIAIYIVLMLRFYAGFWVSIKSQPCNIFQMMLIKQKIWGVFWKI